MFLKPQHQIQEDPTIRLPEDLYHFEPRPRMIFRHAYVGDGDIDIHRADCDEVHAHDTPVAHDKPVACVRDSQIAGKGWRYRVFVRQGGGAQGFCVEKDGLREDGLGQGCDGD